MKNKSGVFKNPRTGEVWLCEDVTNRRVIDGNDFIEVRPQAGGRSVWMAVSALTRIKDSGLSKKVAVKG